MAVKMQDTLLHGLWIAVKITQMRESMTTPFYPVHSLNLKTFLEL